MTMMIVVGLAPVEFSRQDLPVVETSQPGQEEGQLEQLKQMIFQLGEPGYQQLEDWHTVNWRRV